jgi:septal ring factor EnvC (AmiA/AmiB activator)
MTDKTPAAPPADPPAPADPEAARVASIDQKIGAMKDDILTEVRKIVGSAKEGGAAQSAAQEHEAGKLDRPSQSLDQMIADAIAVNDKARAKEAADKDAADRLAKVEAATAEKPPVDRRGVHRFMGWGDPAQ